MKLELTNSTNLTNTEEPINDTIFQQLMARLKVSDNSYIDCNLSNQINLANGENRNSGISLPKAMMVRIDAVKHPDIPRSKFVLRILEAALTQKEMEVRK